MPIYEYKCEFCSSVVEEIRNIDKRNNKTICLKCGYNMQRKTIPSSVSRDWFRPHLNENLGQEPIYVTSKKHYKKLCEDRGVMARCLL